MYRDVILSFSVYEQQGRTKDLPAYLAELGVGGFSTVEMRLDTFFGDRETSESASVALRAGNHQMRTALVETELDDRAQAAPRSLAVASTAERAKGRDLGLEGIVLVPLAGDRPRDDAAVAYALDRCKQLSSSLARRGLWMALHNDAAESADGARVYRALLDGTADNPNIGVAPDIEWLHRGGTDPVAFLQQYKARLKTLHLRQSRDGVWAEELGDGEVDYRAVHKFTRTLRPDLYLVVELNYHPETRQTRRLIDDLKRTRQYVRKVFTV